MKYIYIILVMLCHQSIFGQHSAVRKERNDTTVFLWSGLKIMVLNDPNDKKLPSDTVRKYTKAIKPVRFYRGIDLGLNGLMMPAQFTSNLTGSASHLNQKVLHSYNLHLNIFERRMAIYPKKLSLVTGIGFDFNGFSFSSNKVRLINNQNSNQLSFDTAVSKIYTKNKLNVTSIEVPILLGFASNTKNPNQGIKFAAGVLGSCVLQAKYKLHFDADGEQTQQVIKDPFYIRPFNVKAAFRMGYKGLMFFANYSLLPLFQDGKGPDVRPFEVGIIL